MCFTQAAQDAVQLASKIAIRNDSNCESSRRVFSDEGKKGSASGGLLKHNRKNIALRL
jgi:hypothetical protein